MAPTISSHGRRVMATGLTILSLSVSLGVSFGGYGLLLGLLGVLAGANLISIGVNMADDDPVALTVLLFSITAYVRRNLAVVGIIIASSSVTAIVDGDPGPVLCIAILALHLGISLVTVGVIGRDGV